MSSSCHCICIKKYLAVSEFVVCLLLLFQSLETTKSSHSRVLREMEALNSQLKEVREPVTLCGLYPYDTANLSSRVISE